MKRIFDGKNLGDGKELGKSDPGSINTSDVLLRVVSFPDPSHTGDFSTGERKYKLQIYALFAGGNEIHHLIIKGNLFDNFLEYLELCSPEIYQQLFSRIERGNLFLDLDSLEALTPEGADTTPDTTDLLNALSAITHFPRIHISSHTPEGLVSVVLCGGKGSRMRSRDLHKVCFPVAGIPAVNRLLDSLEKAGVKEHIVVVGEKGLQIVEEISEVRDNVVYVYQINPNGTGNAAKQAAYLLKAQGYTGRVLVVPGDKVIDALALERLRAVFNEKNADLALMVAEKRYWPDAARIVFDNAGNPMDIVEKRDVQKLIIRERLSTLVEGKKTLPKTLLLDVIHQEVSSESKARLIFPELMDYLDCVETLSPAELRKLLEQYEHQLSSEMIDKRFELSGTELERVCNMVNAFVYLFSAEAFLCHIFSLSIQNAQREEYLSELIRLLARDPDRKWKVMPVPVQDSFEVMSFNNPDELLRIEEHYTVEEKFLVVEERACERMDEGMKRQALRPVKEWVGIFAEFGPEIRKVFRRIYGGNENFLAERRNTYLRALKKFISVYGSNHSVIITRSPGRINLMGRHVEQRGGYANFIAINREILLVAGARTDDVIDVHNVDSKEFRPRNFSIRSELSQLPWDDWMNMIHSEKLLEMIRASRGDWSNYFRAAALRLQERFKGHLLHGFNGVLAGNIPLGAGLSSSTAVVVTVAEAMTCINGLTLKPNDFVDLCGEGEWFVGTDEDKGEHAVLKFGKRGNIVHMGFLPIRIERMVPFPEGWMLFTLQSHQSAKKSDNAMQTFNEKITAYEIAQAIIRARFQGFRDKIVQFRDITPGILGISPYEIYDILLNLPDRITRSECRGAILQEDMDRIELSFTSHQEPEFGYQARRVALYGIAEINRARKMPEFLEIEDMEGAGRLMNISHDGDRVSMMKGSERVVYDNSCPDEMIRALGDRLKKGNSTADFHLQPGGYGCSTPLIDEMVDTARSIPGVLGAQLSGAGLGGCIMALVHGDSADRFQETVIEQFYKKHHLPPSVEVCFPIEGSGVVTL